MSEVTQYGRKRRRPGKGSADGRDIVSPPAAPFLAHPIGGTGELLQVIGGIDPAVATVACVSFNFHGTPLIAVPVTPVALLEGVSEVRQKHVMAVTSDALRVGRHVLGNVTNFSIGDGVQVVRDERAGNYVGYLSVSQPSSLVSRLQSEVGITGGPLAQRFSNYMPPFIPDGGVPIFSAPSHDQASAVIRTIAAEVDFMPQMTMYRAQRVVQPIT
jgi:hypothetical protein